jgi:hypothetical protein
LRSGDREVSKVLKEINYAIKQVKLEQQSMKEVRSESGEEPLENEISIFLQPFP